MKKLMILFGLFIFAAVLSAGEVDQSIKRMFDQHDVKYTINSDNDFRVPFKENNVIVNSNTSTYEGLKVRDIWVPLGEIGQRNTSLLYEMLRKNRAMKIGSYCLGSSNDKVYATYKITLPANASWKELWSAILFCSDQELPE